MMATPEVTVSLGPFLTTSRRSNYRCIGRKVHMSKMWNCLPHFALVRNISQTCFCPMLSLPDVTWEVQVAHAAAVVVPSNLADMGLQRVFSLLYAACGNSESHLLVPRKSSLWFHRTFAPFGQRFSESMARNPTRHISSLTWERCVPKVPRENFQLTVS